MYQHWTIYMKSVFNVVHLCNLRKGRTVCMGKIAASVLLKLFINGNENNAIH